MCILQNSLGIEMSDVLVGFEKSHTNAPLVWAKKKGIFQRRGLDVELRQAQFHPGRLNLFNALDVGQVDLIVAPFENAIERMACEYPITMIKQFSRLAVCSSCFASKNGGKAGINSRYIGFADTNFEFDIFAANLNLNRKAIEQYFQVESTAEAAKVLEADKNLILFSSNLSDQSIDIPPDLEILDGEANSSPSSVVLANEMSNGSFRTTSGMSHNSFVELLSVFSESIEEAVLEIRESDDAIKSLASEYSCTQAGLSKRFQEIEWTSGFDPALESTQRITKLLTDAELSPNCDFYDPSEFWKKPTKGRFFGE